MSSNPSSVNRTALMHEVSAALRRSDEAAAQRLLDSADHAPGVLLAAADAAMQSRRWGDAAWILANETVSWRTKRCRS